MRKPDSVEELLAMQSELLRDMFIANLAIAGIPQLQIAKVVQVDINRVNRIAKLLRKARERNSADKPNR